jgi:hypothetical protein
MNALFAEVLLMLVRAFFAKQAERELWKQRIDLAFKEQDATGDHIAVIRSEDQRLKQVLRERKNAGGTNPQ